MPYNNHMEYAPRWRRLPEAIAHIVELAGLSEDDAKRWLIRAMQDRLRGDSVRYAEQSLFRLAGYPMRQTTAVSLYDWPMQVRDDDFNWPESTVYAAHPTRIVAAHVLIEVSAQALSDEFENAGSNTGTPRVPLARDSVIREEIRAVYDEAEVAGLPPPNIRMLSKAVRPSLNARNLDASESHIQQLGNEIEFKARRRKRRATMTSEQRKAK